jgi:hypothetical protein
MIGWVDVFVLHQISALAWPRFVTFAAHIPGRRWVALGRVGKSETDLLPDVDQTWRSDNERERRNAPSWTRA